MTFPGQGLLMNRTMIIHEAKKIMVITALAVLTMHC